MSFSNRLKRYAEKRGFTLHKVPFTNDILSVQFRHHHILTIPKKVYGFPNAYYRDRFNHIQPDYFNREKKLKEWHFTIKRTPYIENYEKDFRWKPFKSF